MKVYNLGNDYAHQRKLKKQETQPENKPFVHPTVSEAIITTNAGDQIQSRGEGEVVESTNAPKTQKQKAKKKKETWTENEHPQDQGQIS